MPSSHALLPEPTTPCSPHDIVASRPRPVSQCAPRPRPSSAGARVRAPASAPPPPCAPPLSSSSSSSSGQTKGRASLIRIVSMGNLGQRGSWREQMEAVRDGDGGGCLLCLCREGMGKAAAMGMAVAPSLPLSLSLRFLAPGGRSRASSGHMPHRHGGRHTDLVWGCPKSGVLEVVGAGRLPVLWCRKIYIISYWRNQCI